MPDWPSDAVRLEWLRLNVHVLAERLRNNLAEIELLTAKAKNQPSADKEDHG
jgi:hypothetical protein